MSYIKLNPSNRILCKFLFFLITTSFFFYFFWFLELDFFKKIELKSICECHKSHKVFLTQNRHNLFQVEYSVHGKMKKSYNFKNQDINFTCDLYSLLKRGKNQKVIGLSLYGTDPLYYNLLKDITKSVKKMYPDWIVRVYYDETILKSTICDIECLKDEDNKLIDNTDFCDINNLPLSLTDHDKTWSASYLHKAIWRWLPIGDSFVDIFSSRDTDSLIHQREIDSVNVWLKSNKIGHIMRGL